MNKINKIKANLIPSRILLTIILIVGRFMSVSAFDQTYNLNVGDQFTVHTSYHYYTQSVLWDYDWKVVEPVGSIYSTSTSVTFKCIAPSPKAGSIIQAVTYYYENSGTYVLKDVNDWKVYVKDNSTVNLSSGYEDMEPGGQLTLTATPSNSSYSGNYTWSSSNYTVAYVSSSSKSATVWAKSAGRATITVTLDNGNSAKCEVNVNPVDVTSASVTPFKLVYIDETETLSLSVNPSNATVTSKTWKSKNSNIATVSSTGEVTGVSAGKTEVYCIVNGSVTSSSCEVTVLKPNFTLSSTTPSDGATGQSVHINPSMTFCRQIYEGSSFSKIKLEKEGGKTVKGTASISGSTLTFTPSKPLDPKTSYTFSVPSQAVKDKYGSTNSIVKCLFKTGNLEKLTLTPSTTKRFIAKGSKVTLTCNKSGVSIYYTLDGSTPTSTSQKYKNGIIIDSDIQLRAIATGPGYVKSDILAVDYLVSNVDVATKFPVDEDPLYLYQEMLPHITFSNIMEAGDNIKNVVLKKNGSVVKKEIIVHDKTLFLVPEDPLALGCSYTVDIPAGAVKSWQGEKCKAVTWSFTTGEFATGISAGPAQMTAIKTDGSLWTWGELLTKANAEDGSYSYTFQKEPVSFVSDDVVAVSAGYMHNALLKRDGSLWMWGRQLCGEFGNGSTTASAQPVKVMDGVKSVSCGLQTTAIVKKDGTLWMCGRNDLGQIDESRMVKTEFVKVAKGVREVELNWGSLLIVKSDGTNETRTWSKKVDSKRKPVKPKNLKTEFSEVKYGWKNAVALGIDGSVWTWNDSSSDGTPKKVVKGRKSSALKGLTAANPTVSVGVGSKTVLVAKPLPLTADYTTLTWKSNNSKIAKVNSRGVVTGVAKGSATITAEITSANGKHFSQTFNVTVCQLRLNKSEVIVQKGKTVTLKLTLNPSSSTDKSVTWTSSNTKIATVTSDGQVKGVKAGIATITCTSHATGAKATCNVTVGYVKLDKTETVLEKGKTLILTATVYPSSLTDKSVSWESSDPKIATVSTTGKVKGVKAGTATITCTSNATGLKTTCTVTIGYVKLDKTEVSLGKGKTVTLKATVYPSSLTDKSVTWESSNKKIATVTSEGKVKGVKAGTATITCTSNATGLKATCEVTVTAAGTRSQEGDEDEEAIFEEKDLGPAAKEPFDVYDLSGRKVKSQVTSLDGLPRGIYIINGKKVMKQ